MHCVVRCVCCGVLCVVVCCVYCAACVVRCAVCCGMCCLHFAVCGVLCGCACTSSCHFAAADEPGTRHVSSPPFEITAAAYVALGSVPTGGSSVDVVHSYKWGDRESVLARGRRFFIQTFGLAFPTGSRSSFPWGEATGTLTTQRKAEATYPLSGLQTCKVTPAAPSALSSGIRRRVVS